MRSFLILGFLAAVASAGVLPGYKYGPGISGVRQEIEVGHHFGHHHGPHYNNAFGLIGSAGYGSSGNAFISSGNYKQTGETGTVYAIGTDDLDYVPPAVSYSKQFYHFDAPPEAQLEGKITKQLSNSLKKNLQVVFIKAPENNAATNAALQLAKQAIEQKTDIYVLSKQHDQAHLIGQFQQIQENVQHAPEVRFVKYRTPEDAQLAKQAIQSQYDNVGGVSEIYNGGVAPVLNYASDAKPSQVIFGGSRKTYGSYYAPGSKYGSAQFVGAGNNFQSGSYVISPESIESGSKFQSGAYVSKPQFFESGSKFQSGAYVSKPQSFESSSKFQSGAYVSKPQPIESGSKFQSGAYVAKPQSIESSSKFQSGAYVSKPQSIASASSNSKSDSSASSSESLGSESKLQSGSSSSASSSQSNASGSNNLESASAQLIESGNIFQSGSSQSFGSGSTILQSASPQLIELGSLDSLSNAGLISSNLPTVSYLPPLELKK